MLKWAFWLLIICSVFCYLSHNQAIQVDPGIRSILGTWSYEDELTRKTVKADKYEVVVDLTDNLNRENISELENSIHEQLLSVCEDNPHRLMVVRMKDNDPIKLDRIIQVLRNDVRVETAEPNYCYRIPEVQENVNNNFSISGSLGEPNDPLFKYQWHMNMVKAPDAWKFSNGDGAVVAVIDTGVTHTGNVVEDLVSAEFVHPFNFLNNTTNANDDHGHGTHVAGTISQVTNNGIGCVGVAPKSKIMPLKVLSKHGYGSIAGIAAAIMYAADKGANVINMSLGGPYPSEVLGKAVKYAYDKGVIVVCAAGNSGPDGNSVGYPAAFPHAVAVSSVDSLGNLAWYSSWGPEVAIAAPGGDTRSDHNGDGLPDGVLQNTIDTHNPKNMAHYAVYQGTSMASPHAAGVAALIVSLGVKDPGKIIKIMRDTAQKKDNPEKFGAGIVDAFAAVYSVKQQQCLDYSVKLLILAGVPVQLISVLGRIK